MRIQFPPEGQAGRAKQILKAVSHKEHIGLENFFLNIYWKQNYISCQLSQRTGVYRSQMEQLRQQEGVDLWQNYVPSIVLLDILKTYKISPPGRNNHILIPCRINEKDLYKLASKA